ncbi:MAG: zinc-ribbon domain-containing protein [Pseudomonadota bacterium]
MVEIECPNCGARYQVPAEALGANGRDVTCSSCGNIWHAMPIEEGPIDVSAIGVQTQPPRRSAQMAEIRQMLDQVQRGDERQSGGFAAEKWSGDEDGTVARGREDVRRAVFGQNYDDEDDEIERTESFLRDRAGRGGQSARLRAVGSDGTRETDGAGQRKRMMSKHRRRHRKFEEAKRRGTGAGLTGFVFVALVLGTLTALYTFKDQIGARIPGTQASLDTYALVVDDLRAGLQARLGGIEGSIEDLGGDEG